MVLGKLSVPGRPTNLDDGWMTCNFTSFSTVFQSYQDDERLIVKAVCSGTPFTVEKILS